MTCKHPFKRSFILGLVITSVFLAHGQEESLEEEAVLEPYIVTGTGMEERTGEVPYTVNVLDEMELREEGHRSFPEVFAEMPGVLVQKTAHGQGSPYIRGFTGFRNLLLIDGIRLNHAAFREGPNQYWATVDPLAVSQLEVVKGQGSVLHGSEAIGGTVNALTKEADVWGHAKGEAFGGGLAYYRWNSGTQSHTGRVEGQAGVGGRTGFHLGYTVRSVGDIRAADLGVLPRTGYEEWGIDTRMDHYLSEKVKLTLAYQQFLQDDVWRTHRTLYGRSWEGTTVGDERRRVLDQSRHLAYARVEAKGMDGWVDEMRATLSWQRHEEEQDRVRGDGRRDEQGFDLDSVGLTAQLTSATPLGELVYGASYYRDAADSYHRDYAADGTFRRERLQGPIGDDALYDLGGLFLQDRIEVGDRFDLVLGGRYTYARADIGEVEDPLSGERMRIDEEWHDFSASVRGLWDITGEGTTVLYGGVSQGFRAPNFSDLSRLDTARSDELETASPGLDPEEFLTYEVGARLEGERWTAGLALYYTDVDDLIVRTPTGRRIDGDAEVIKRNGGSGYVYGLEAEASWRFTDEVRVFGHFSWNDGREETFPTSAPWSEEEPMSRLLPPTGMLGVRWEPSSRWWLEATGQWVGQQDRLNTRDREDTQRIPPGGTPGYGLLHLRAGWEVTEDFAVTFAVENVTDEAYRAHGSGQNEPGVSVVFGGTYAF